MAGARVQQLAVGGAVEVDPGRIACGGERLAVGGKGEGEDETFVALAGAPLGAGGRREDADGVIDGAGSDRFAVGAECTGADGAIAGTALVDRLAGVDRPLTQGAGFADT